ncbi:hypothetical protein ACFQVC_31215 [Streptomyces monticola]|uniref:Sensor histidine kinase n=1 Tax=Streptomyces monticola TaxID=2666263 RepID=A0ABW2JRT9_9ACTN
MTGGTEFDEQLRAGFQSQGQSGPTSGRRRDARQARRLYAGLAAVVALVALVLTVVRLAQGGGAGAWTALYVGGGVVSACGVPLARIGRTRWAFAAMCLGAALAMLGDSPMFR